MNIKDIEKVAYDFCQGEPHVTTALTQIIAQQVDLALEEAAKINLDPAMREQYVMQGPRCLATAANRIRALKIFGVS